MSSEEKKIGDRTFEKTSGLDAKFGRYVGWRSEGPGTVEGEEILSARPEDDARALAVAWLRLERRLRP